MTQHSDQRFGVAAALGAYVCWGMVPIFWPLLAPSSALEVLAHRIVWAFAFSLLLAAALRVRWWEILGNRRHGLRLLASSLMVSTNWGIYIWAVNHGHVIDAALGYYINPVLSILAGVLILRERLSIMRWVALGIVTVAVIVLTLNCGTFPWVAFGLATSFAAYGLIKKQVGFDAVASMTIESMLATPFALLLLTWWGFSGRGTFFSGSIAHGLLVVASGLVTIIPLVLFAYAAPRIQLSTMGILQYLSPTCQFLLALIWFSEPMPTTRWVGFALVWVALMLISVEGLLGLAVRRRARATSE